jgi:hypothetical protein
LVRTAEELDRSTEKNASHRGRFAQPEAAATAETPIWQGGFANHFVSDVFWLALRAIGVGLVPALHELEQLHRAIHDMHRAIQAGRGGTSFVALPQSPGVISSSSPNDAPGDEVE